MSIRLVMGGTRRAALLAVLFLVAATPASAALVLADSFDHDQPGLPNVGEPGAFPDNGYDGTLGSMEQFTLDVHSDLDMILGLELSLWLDHGAAGDVFVKLESPQGTIVTVINRPGIVDAGDDAYKTGTNANFGPAGDPVELFFYDAAPVGANMIGKDVDGGEIIGVDGDAITDYSPEADGSEHDGGFAAFIGEDPNGTWTLHIADTMPTYMGGGQGGELSRWQLRIQVIPEPATLAMFGLGGALLAARKRSRRGLPTG